MVAHWSRSSRSIGILPAIAIHRVAKRPQTLPQAEFRNNTDSTQRLRAKGLVGGKESVRFRGVLCVKRNSRRHVCAERFPASAGRKLHFRENNKSIGKSSFANRRIQAHLKLIIALNPSVAKGCVPPTSHNDARRDSMNQIKRHMDRCGLAIAGRY
jgi:hypothetical protein